ncbi:hypothetical protein [Roseomonas elaeocarpi]|uniref:Uncharacterized protein n=1 Tax=Roseomonas elaeocarpi TaxID=907779 RepID=A0ABV6JT27_9PROT
MLFLPLLAVIHSSAGFTLGVLSVLAGKSVAKMARDDLRRALRRPPRQD